MKKTIQDYGYIKVAAAVPMAKVADCAYNANEIARNITFAKNNAGANLIVLPELCITSVSCGELIMHKQLREAALNALWYIAQETRHLNIIAVVGLPLELDGGLYNAAVVLHEGEILGVVPKCGGDKYYADGAECRSTAVLFGTEVPVGTQLLFSQGQLTFGIEIGDDFARPNSHALAHSQSGARLIVNPCATPSIIGSFEYAESMIKAKSAQLGCGYIHVSAGAGESTSEQVYSSHVIIAECGDIIAGSGNLSLSNKLIVTDIDTEICGTSRKLIGGYRSVTVAKELDGTLSLSRSIAKNPFIPNGDELQKRIKLIIDTICVGFARRLMHTGIKCPVLNVSGGLDSTAALLMLTKVTDMLSLPRSNIKAITLPCFGTTSRTRNNSVALSQGLGAELREIDISNACRQHFLDIGHGGDADLTFENTQARERTQVALDLTTMLGGIMVGTCDLSEIVLGFATYGGDHLSMYNLNSGIPKTLLPHLIQYFAAQEEYQSVSGILADIINTPISPELLPPDENGEIAQRTQEIVGDYAVHDFFIYYAIRRGFDKEKILFLANAAFKGQYHEDYLKKCLDTFWKRFLANQFKRRCSSDNVRIGTVALGGAFMDIPSDVSSTVWL